jgi:hypothetical protein
MNQTEAILDEPTSSKNKLVKKPVKISNIALKKPMIHLENNDEIE